MFKKFITMILISIFIVLALVGCGKSDDNSTESPSEINTIEQQEHSSDVDSGDNGDENVENTSEDFSTSDAVADLSWLKEDSSSICSGMYVVGEDIIAGNYTLKCTEADYALHITIFKDKSSYESYFRSSRFTVGEENDAIEKYAKASEYIYPDSDYAFMVNDGNIIVLDGGIGTFGNGTSMDVGGTITLSGGVYEAGEIPVGSYIVTTLDAGYSLEFIVFENKDAYDSFVEANPFTVGEYNEQTEKNALSHQYILTDAHGYISVRDGNVIMIIGNDGKAEFTQVDMSWK